MLLVETTNPRILRISTSTHNILHQKHTHAHTRTIVQPLWQKRVMCIWKHV